MRYAITLDPNPLTFFSQVTIDATTRLEAIEKLEASCAGASRYIARLVQLDTDTPRRSPGAS